jgi:hypothetical protein
LPFRREFYFAAAMTISPVDVNLPQTLRLKAAEFRRLARDAREPRSVLDLQYLADDYEQQADDLFPAAQAAPL